MASCYSSAVQYHRYLCTDGILCNIWRSGYDLYGLCFPYVDLAHYQLVSVRMTFYGKNFTYYDLFQIFI